MALLTDAKARKITTETGALADGGVPGLYLHPASDKGPGKWILRFVSPRTGKRRDMGLGRYPEVSIRDVRDAALRARQVIQDGRDPIDERRLQTAAAQAEVLQSPSFESAARTFMRSWPAVSGTPNTRISGLTRSRTSSFRRSAPSPSMNCVPHPLPTFSDPSGSANPRRLLAFASAAMR